MKKIGVGICLFSLVLFSNYQLGQAQNIKIQNAKIQNMEVQSVKVQSVLPTTQNLTILGENLATPEQAVLLIKSVNPKPLITCSVEELVAHYFQEAEKEGIRGDVALSQALLETGFFRYGGSVGYQQNNFCGLGSTGKNVGGARFNEAKIGVRAHIQHLLVYTSKKNPSESIVDPRFEVVRKIPRIYASARTWNDLDGRWATSKPYGSKILDIHSRMLAMPKDTVKKNVSTNDLQTMKTKENKKNIQTRIQAILRNEK